VPLEKDKADFLELLSKDEGSTPPSVELVDRTKEIKELLELLGRLEAVVLVWESEGHGDGGKAWRKQHDDLQQAIAELQSAKPEQQTDGAFEEIKKDLDHAIEQAGKELGAWEQWASAAANMEKAVLAALASGKGDREKIRGVWAFAHGKAEAGDPITAVKALGPLVNLLRDAANAAKTQAEEDVAGSKLPLLTAKWQHATKALAPLVQNAQKVGIKEEQRLVAAWAVVQEEGQRGIDTANVAALEKALRAAADVGAILKSAKPEEMPTGTVQRAKDSLVLDAERKQAVELHASAMKLAKLVVKRVKDALGTTIPVLVGTDITNVEALYDLADETDGTRIKKVATDLAEATEKLETDSAKPIADKAAWEASKAVFEIRLDLLKNHAQAKAADAIKNLITPVDQAYEAAKNDAGTMKWEAAFKALPALFTACDTITDKADALAELTVVKAKRKLLVDALPAEGTLTYEVTKKPVAAARKDYTDAIQAETNGDLVAARDFLNLIPEAVDVAREAVRLESAYTDKYTKIVNKLALINAKPKAVKDLLAPELAEITKYVEDSAVDKTNDLRVSSVRVATVDGGYTALTTSAALAEDYVNALTAFDVRLEAVKTHKGRAAIEAFYTRLQADRLLATTLATKKNFALATSTLESGEPEQIEQIATAALGEEYLEKKKKNEEELQRLTTADTTGVAASPLADARTQIANGATAGTNNQWKDAVACAKEAATRLTVADGLLKNAKALGDKKDTGKLDAIGTNFQAAYAVYNEMRQFVNGKDADAAFTTLLATADAPAQKAVDESTQGEPDWNKARGFLDTAIAVCERALPLIGLRPGYVSLDATLQTAHDATLPPLNTDNCVKTEIDALKKLRTDAANLVKAPGFDYAGGLALLATGLPLAQLGSRKGAAYAKWKPKLDEIGNAITYLEDVTRAAGVPEEIAKLKDFRTRINDHFSNGRVVEAGKLADEAEKLIDAYKDTADKYVDWKDALDNEIPGVRTPVENEAACKPEFDVAEALLTDAKALATKHAYLAALGVAASAYWGFKGAKDKLDAHDAYEAARAVAETKIGDAKAVKNAAIKEALEKLEERYKAAVALATGERRFIKAKDDVTPLAQEATDLLPLAKAGKECTEARTAAETSLGAAKNHANAKDIAALLLHLDARLEAGKTLETKRDYAAAKALFVALDTQSKAALEEAKEQGKLAALTTSVKDLPVDDKQKLTEAVQAARTLRTKMMEEPSALAAVGPMLEAHDALEAADKALEGDKLEEARTQLGAALAAIGAARTTMGRYAQIASEAKVIGDALDDLANNHAQKAFVQAEIVEERKKIEAALVKVRSSGAWEQANNELAAIDAAARRLRAAADGQVAYLAERAKVETDLDKLEKHKHRYAAVDEIKEVRKALGEAATQAAAHVHLAAQKLLAKAVELLRVGTVKATCHADDVPDVDSVKTILGGDKGPEALDKIVDGLERDAKRKVMRVAFEARFGCKLTVFASEADETSDTVDPDQDKRTPNIRKFYDLMAKLPLVDTRDNESMALFTEVEEYKGSDFGQRKVTMREGEFGKSASYGIGLPNEVGKVDADSEPVGDHRPTYFEWNTVHEVGHAVDDRAGFMEKQGQALGGWKSYGGNVVPIAKAVADHFQYDEKYVIAYMSGQTPAIVAPVGCEPDEWERRRAQCVSWVDSARSDKDPWSTDAQAKRLAIDGVVYHESYEGVWSSYPLDQRKKAVTGYQFRAPGEWFAELYAAYHCKKLNPSHPANTWLSKL
jgi:hypothetical protein